MSDVNNEGGQVADDTLPVSGLPVNTADYMAGALLTESKDYIQIMPRLVANTRLIHAVFGMLTETGEFADNLKAHIFYGKPLDPVNLKEEIGDLFWYVAIALDELGETSFAPELVANTAKLAKRYGSKFDADKAVKRNLMAERKILEGGV